MSLMHEVLSDLSLHKRAAEGYKLVAQSIELHGAEDGYLPRGRQFLERKNERRPICEHGRKDKFRTKRSRRNGTTKDSNGPEEASSV